DDHVIAAAQRGGVAQLVIGGLIGADVGLAEGLDALALHRAEALAAVARLVLGNLNLGDQPRVGTHPCPVGPAPRTEQHQRLLALCPAAIASPPKKLGTVEGITEYALDNGLHVLVFPDPSRPTVTVNLTVLVGSRQEGYGETGMAHLLEHMAFKGTPTHPNIF